MRALTMLPHVVVAPFEARAFRSKVVRTLSAIKGELQELTHESQVTQSDLRERVGVRFFRRSIVAATVDVHGSTDSGASGTADKVVARADIALPLSAPGLAQKGSG